MAAQRRTFFCTKHPGTAKVSLANGKNAPMLGCPICHGLEAADEPTPSPAPQPTPKTDAPKRSRGTFFGLALES